MILVGYLRGRGLEAVVVEPLLFFFFFTLFTGPRRSLSLKLSDTRDYEPPIRASLGTTAHYLRGRGLEAVVGDVERRYVAWFRV